MSTKPIDPVYFRLFQLEPDQWSLKKVQVLEAAVECLAREGLEGTTLDRIGKRAKISRSHVVYYFESMDQVIHSAIRFITLTAQGITVEKIQEAREPRQQLEAIVHAAFDWAERYPDQAKVMMVFYSLCTHDDRYRKINTQIREAGRERIVTLLARFPHLKPFKKAELGIAAREIQLLVTGYLLESMTLEDTMGNCRALALEAVLRKARVGARR